MAEALRLFEDRIQTPVGELAVITDADGHLRAVDWTEHAVLGSELQRLDLVHPAQVPLDTRPPS